MESLEKQFNKLQINNKVKRTLFWGIELNVNDILNFDQIKNCLESNKQLIPLKKMHSTMLYVGGKENNDENVYFNLENKECLLTIDAHGLSNNALALRVLDIKLTDEPDNKIPSFAIKQHVTVALDKNTKPVDSVKTLLGDGVVYEYDNPLILKGKLIRNFQYVKLKI